MKKESLLLTIIISFFAMSLTNQKQNAKDALSGAWQLTNAGEDQVLIFADGYFTQTTYNRANKKFIQTRGGAYESDNNDLMVQFEFDTKDTAQIGKTLSYKFSVKEGQFSANINGREETWRRIDSGNTGLYGLWKITARKQDSKLNPIHQTGTRKTIKILSSTRFQWAAIDPGTKQFMGTGGGIYTFKEGKYTEHIEFFSRDNSRVGGSLTFDGKLENGDWHHSGLSSRGEPIYEVWSRKK